MKFFDQVYAFVREIALGKVTTYGKIAKALGTKDARKVGWALHANSDPKTPCHRVVDRTGRVAPNFARLQRFERSDCGQAFDGWREQKRRLEAEGVTFIDDMHVDLKKHLWHRP